MASARKVTEKRHNPVESLRRKIRAIQKREELPNPTQPIIKYQSSSFDGPQTNTRRDFEDMLKKMTAVVIPTPNAHFSGSEKDNTSISFLQTMSPRTPATSHLSSPMKAMYSDIPTSSGNISRLSYMSLVSQIRKGEPFSNKDLNDGQNENHFSTLALDFDSTSDQSSEIFTPRESVVKRCSLNEDGRKLGTDDSKKDVTCSISGTREEDFFTSAFRACAAQSRGSVEIAKIIDYLRQTTSQDSDAGSFEELWNTLDPDKKDLLVDLETFHAIMKEWMACCRNKRKGVNSGSGSSVGHSVLEQDSIKSGAAIRMTTDIAETTSRSFEAFSGDVSKGFWEVSDLITYVADLHFNKQKREEENRKLKLALETLEETNRQLSEDRTELYLQLKSAHQAIMRTNLLREELEELRAHLNASEDQKTDIVAQNKELETENRALILKIRTLQEENTKNLMDIYALEKNIEELSKTEAEHQMQLHMYENTLLNKDASLQKKDLSIEELKSAITEYGSIIENLRGDKDSLARELQHLQQERLAQKQLEAMKQLQEDAVNLGAILREEVEAARSEQEDAELQPRGAHPAHTARLRAEEPTGTAHPARGKAKALLRALEGAISEEPRPQTINTEVVNTCQTLEQEPRQPKTSIKSLTKKLLKGQLQGLLLQSCADEEFPHYDPSSCADTIQCLQEQLKQCCCKKYSGQEARIHQIPLIFKHTCWYTPLLDALHLDSLTLTPRLSLTPFSCVADQIHASRERPKYENIEDGALDVTGAHKLPGPTVGPTSGTDPPYCVRMNEDLSMEENGTEHLNSESLPQSRKYSTLSSPGHTSSTESTVTSSDAGSETLNMASGDLDCKSLCEKEGDTRSESAVMKVKDTSSAPESVTFQGSVSEDNTMSNLEANKDPKPIDEHRCIAGDPSVSSLPGTTVKLVNFKQSDNTSANEKEVEAEFLRLSLGFKCDWFTLEKRVKLEERTRDLAEENLKKEITNCLKLLESLTPLCEDDNQAQEILKKLEKSIKFLSVCAERVASRAEMLGAINQESRVSKAVEVMIQHVENLKRMYAKEHAELEDLKQVLLQNERSFNPLEDEDDCQVKKRSASLNSKPSSLRRVTIASLPRNIGNTAMAAGVENNDRLSRRSSSWRVLGSKQSEHRPSLHRFISTYSWADGEEEKCELKTKDDSEPPGEEIVDRTRKPSLSEKRNNSSKWDVCSVYDTVASWATHLKTSVRKANKALWLSVALIVLFAALMSFLTGRFFQKSVDAAPTQDGDAWMSLEHILWPFTRLRHNGPPPV